LSYFLHCSFSLFFSLSTFHHFAIHLIRAKIWLGGCLFRNKKKPKGRKGNTGEMSLDVIVALMLFLTRRSL
jgi:hypothetical protein